MNSFWQAFLQQQGAAWNEDGVQYHFAAPPADRPRLMDLSHLGVLRCEGEMAAKFLQGQLTCDVNAVSADNSVLGGLCTHKGALLSLFRLVKDDTGYLFGMRRDMVESTRATLAKYIVFFKATLSDASDDWVRLGLTGEGSDNILQALFDDAPETPGQVMAIEGGHVIRIAGNEPRFELWLSPERAKKLWVPITEHAFFTSSELWEAEEVKAALPDITPATVDTFIPQMLNLQALGGISFKKGCYTGQEIVARMQFVGSLKRNMHLASVSSKVKPVAGATLTSEKREVAGQIVRAARIGENSYQLLAVLYRNELDAPIWLTEDSSATLNISQELPYEIDPEVFERNRPKL
ncbi:YgfZ/GcvT domain-containing protein [Pokkaliibacter sp. CJK22405]|uniref:CAF17-like 4Fe-4S cluster assembly/insertion protein YgfZ n=1 Tax=Pokkaliibacter sp. CJK22405 TaxID=3384615 RepID=UPI003984DE27